MQFEQTGKQKFTPLEQGAIAMNLTKFETALHTGFVLGALFVELLAVMSYVM